MWKFDRSSPSSCAPSPAVDDGDRVDALVDRRWEVERRRFAVNRQRRAMLVFAATWWIVPIFETLAGGAVAPMVLVFHLGLVLPWGILVASPAEGRAATTSLDAAGGGVATMAALATLLGHRFSPVADLRAFDGLAILPILYFQLFVRPRTSIAATVAAFALVAFAVAIFDGRRPDAEAWGQTTAALFATAIATIAGRRHDDEVARAHRARIRADIAAHRLTHSNDELRLLSEIDTLTGLANRRAIDLRLPEIAERSEEEREVIGVMMIDVDHFKIFNDRFGHQAGDRCLAAVARATADQIRRHGDLVGRWGGEEFLAVLPGAGLEATVRVAERIRVAVERRGDPADPQKRLGATVSIGCAAGVVAAGHSIGDLLRAADEQLYAAKRDGRNRISPPPQGRGPGEPGPDRAAA